MRVSLIISAALIVSCTLGLFIACDNGYLAFVHLLQKAESGQKKVACIGDSITYGSGMHHWIINNYPRWLGYLLGNDFCVNNYGCSGRTVSSTGDFPYRKEKIFQKSLSFLPDVVLIMMGTNDSKPQNWKGREAYSEDLENLIKIYQSLPSEPRIFLMTPPPAWGIGDQKVLYDISCEIIETDIRSSVKTVAEKTNVDMIDAFAVFENRPDLFHDGVHPNADGAQLMAQTTCQMILSKGDSTI